MTTSEQPITDDSYLPPMLNPFEPGFFDDPYAQYALVREQDPVHLSPIGAWALFRYDDVLPRAARPAPSVEERHANLPPPTIPADLQDLDGAREQRGNHTMLNLDPPDHHRLRRLVSKVFTPRMIEELRPRVQQLVDEYLDAAEARGTGEMDVIADLAFPLPFIDHLGDARHPRRRRPRAAPRVVGRDREGRSTRSSRPTRSRAMFVASDAHRGTSRTSSSSGSARTRATTCSPG